MRRRWEEGKDTVTTRFMRVVHLTPVAPGLYRRKLDGPDEPGHDGEMGEARLPETQTACPAAEPGSPCDRAEPSPGGPGSGPGMRGR